MVDIGIASASSGTDALSLLRSGRSRNSDDDSSGFLDAMTNSGSGKTAAGDDDTTDDDAKASNTTTTDSELPDGKIKGSALTTSGTDLDAVTVPATAATTIANAALFPKGLPLSAVSAPAGKTVPAAGTPTSQTSTTAATATATATDATGMTATGANASVADAMASLGVAPPADMNAAPDISVAGPIVPPTDGKAAAQASSTTKLAPALTSTPATTAAQPVSGSDQAVPVSPDAGTSVKASPQPAADIMQQLAAIVGDGSPAQPVVDGTASTTATPGKTAAASGDGDTKTDTDTDTATKGDITADATDAPSGAVTDALSLLNVAAPMAAQVQAQAQAQATPGILAGAGLAVTSSGKSQASTGTGSTSPVASPRGKTSAVAADALDTSAAAADSDETTAFMPTSLAALKASAAGGSKSGTAATTDDNSTATFRIARADSKVQALDMAISKNADDTTQADVQAASGTGTETVTVLDSRRYLGLADGSNSALVANTLSGNKDWSSAMKAGSTAATTAVASNTSKVVNTLKIQMNPEKLGTVTATMRLSGETLSVDLKVQSAEAYRQLSNDQGPMVDSLRAQGYKVDNITVTYAPQATTDSGQQQNSQAGFQGQQQSGASQGQGGEAQSRRQNSGQRTGDQDGNWGTQNVGSDDSVAGNAQRTRSSGVYL